MPYDCDDKTILKKILFKQADNIGRSLRRINLYTSTIAVTLKMYDFCNCSKQVSLANSTNLTEDIYNAAISAFEQIWNEEKVRNIGIRISNFTNVGLIQTSLFNNFDKKDKVIQQTIDSLKNRFGSEIIFPASLLNHKE